MRDKNKELIKAQESAVVVPAMTDDDLFHAIQAYESFKTRLLKEDEKKYAARIGDKLFPTKAFWRQLAHAYNIDVIKIDESSLDVPGHGLTFYATYRATAPNGKRMDGDGACSINEKGLKKNPHVARAIAHTRAKNRAISDLCGGGEVSAEEMFGQDNAHDYVDADYTVVSGGKEEKHKGDRNMASNEAKQQCRLKMEELAKAWAEHENKPHEEGLKWAKGMYKNIKWDEFKKYSVDDLTMEQAGRLWDKLEEWRIKLASGELKEE